LTRYVVVRQIIAFNPASSVRGPKHSVKVGKTPVLSAAETRAQLDGIDTDNLVSLRDRALIGPHHPALYPHR
jgi:site-specific recombinase XerC